MLAGAEPYGDSLGHLGHIGGFPEGCTAAHPAKLTVRKLILRTVCKPAALTSLFLCELDVAAQPRPQALSPFGTALLVPALLHALRPNEQAVPQYRRSFFPSLSSTAPRAASQRSASRLQIILALRQIADSVVYHILQLLPACRADPLESCRPCMSWCASAWHGDTPRHRATGTVWAKPAAKARITSPLGYKAAGYVVRDQQ